MARYKVIDDYFSIPNTENSYWAGFIAADGSILELRNAVKLSLSNKDVSTIENFKHHLSYEGPISHCSKREKSGAITTQSYIRVASKIMVDDLNKNFNITPRKTFTLEPPINLNFENSLAYIIGLFDGDGCITAGKYYKKDGSATLIPSIQFLGTYNVLLWVKNIFSQIGDVGESKLFQRGKIWAWYSTKQSVLHIMKDIDKRISCPKMERKWNKIRDF